MDMEKSTDMGVVMLYIDHIDNPCSFEHEGKRVNVRRIYIEQARRILETHEFENPFAKELLEEKVKEYS